MQELSLFPQTNASEAPIKPKRQRKPKAPKDPNAPRKLGVPQIIITKFVIGMKGCYNPVRWKEEMQICRTLRKTYKDAFLMWLEPIEGYQVSSLVFYLGALGRNYLSDQLVEFTRLNPPERKTSDIPLEEAKIGEDVALSPKPQTLKEFLNYGKELARRQTAGQTAGQTTEENPTTDSDGADVGVS